MLHLTRRTFSFTPTLLLCVPTLLVLVDDVNDAVLLPSHEALVLFLNAPNPLPLENAAAKVGLFNLLTTSNTVVFGTRVGDWNEHPTLQLKSILVTYQLHV